MEFKKSLKKLNIDIEGITVSEDFLVFSVLLLEVVSC